VSVAGGVRLYVPTIGDPKKKKTKKKGKEEETVKRPGYVVMDFAFTESDSSNARQYVLQGVSYIDENKDKWKEQAQSGAAGLFGGGKD
jgi:hypothetical protein